MAKSPYKNRKFSDEDLLRLNSVGLTLGTISKLFSVHQTSLTARFKTLGIKPADTRRSFMENIFLQLTTSQQDWIADQLGPTHTIQELLKDLIITEFARQNRSSNVEES